ncbi:helix-turn-helix transcriptional regulator [Rhizobium jaguaris]|uniref:helix-turn-helix domain-containing protein n=1 Tax=Rhizobium jaguaris TaxID=1312183 RepID=UPI0039BFC10A
METVNRLLHAAREALDLGQSDVAEATGVSTRTLHRIENGQGLVGFENLTKLRVYFERLGIALVELDDPKKWAIVFDSDLAPKVDRTEKNTIYDPVPGSVLKAARVLASLSQAELAALTNFGHPTIRKLENTNDGSSPERRYVVQTLLEKSGVEFLKPTEQAGWALRITR